MYTSRLNARPYGFLIVIHPFFRYNCFVRLDLFLKTCRLVKRRAVARELCDAGRARVNGHESKPAKEVRPGDRITLLFSTKRIELEVLDVPASSKKINAAPLYRVIAEKRREQEDNA
jgi:ribosomal 50S subunit-recycling heat shock protein